MKVNCLVMNKALLALDNNGHLMVKGSDFQEVDNSYWAGEADMALQEEHKSRVMDLKNEKSAFTSSRVLWSEGMFHNQDYHILEQNFRSRFSWFMKQKLSMMYCSISKGSYTGG